MNKNRDILDFLDNKNRDILDFLENLMCPGFLCVLSACLLALSFPPFHWNVLAWIALIPLFWALERAGSKRLAFACGYFTGFLFFLAVLHWIHWVTIPGLVLLSAYLAIFFGALGILYRWSSVFPLWLRVFLFPAGWTVLEYLRGTLFTGFNWGSLGHTQATIAWLVPAAAVTGVGGISFLVIFLNTAVWGFWRARRDRTALKPLVLSVGAGLLLFGFLIALCRFGAAAKGEEGALTVAVIQPNIALTDAWNPAFREDLVRWQIGQSHQALSQKPDLIIWPENSFPNFLKDLPELFGEVTAFARENRVSLLIGAVTEEEGNYFNAALLIGPEGEILKVHHKRHLVLFGEYIPFRRELPFLSALAPIDDFTAGQNDTVFILPGGARFSVLICFEDTVPELARRDALKGVDFLVNMTNDAWFGDSGQQKMHLHNALFRAAENGRTLVRATNTGESCVLSRAGAETACLEGPKGRRVLVDGVLTVRVPLGGARTLYTKYGEIFTFLCFLGILGALTESLYRRRKGQTRCQPPKRS